MPTYEYECSACSHRFDAFQQMSDPRMKKCPECGKHTLQRLFGTGLGIIFKGSGFFVNDQRTNQAKASSGSAEKSTKKSTQSGETASKKAPSQSTTQS